MRAHRARVEQRWRFAERKIPYRREREQPSPTPRRRWRRTWGARRLYSPATMTTDATPFPRLSLVTLGTVDLVRARRFYEMGLGFRVSSSSNDSVAFLDGGSVVISLYGRAALAEDAMLRDDLPDGAPAGTFSGFTLAWNVGSRDEVDLVMARAARAGAKMLKPAAEAFWGGYSGYFADPDGFAWEVAHNPHWPLDAHGKLVLP